MIHATTNINVLSFVHYTPHDWNYTIKIKKELISITENWKCSKLNKRLSKKCKKIKLLVTDVDGVLTDGGMYYSNNGEYLKKFHTRDGMGIELLLKYRIKTIAITKEDSEIVKTRMKKINVEKLYSGITQKETELENICREFEVNPSQIAYIGDDVNDIELMKKVGFSASPNDGIAQVKRIADYVCKTNGGDGVLREVADLIISTNL